MWLPNGGVWLDILNPDYTEVTIEDIVIPLSLITRFTGQLPQVRFENFWRGTVLTHMGLCYDIADGWGIDDQRVLRTIFLHDAQEALVQDVAGPVKRAMRTISKMSAVHEVSDYDVIEDRHEVALAKRFDLIMPKPEIVHKIDRLALAFEIREHFGEARLTVGESLEDPDSVPPVALSRRQHYSDPSLLLRLARVLTT